MQLYRPVIKSFKHKEKEQKKRQNAATGDIFNRFPFSILRKTVLLFFPSINFLMFQFPRTEVSLIGLKNNFAHHDNCTKREELEVDKGAKDTMVVVVE